MDHLDRVNIEKLLSDPTECDYRIIIREFFEYKVPLKCPMRAMVKAFFDKLIESEKDKNSGLI